MGALGYVMQVPEEEKYLNTEAELRDMLVGLVGGRAAEEVVFDTVTTGAANDIEKATSIARNMITRYGMSKRFGLVGLATVESQYLEGRTALNCSDETAAAIDEEVVAMIKESYDQALQMLRENRELMDKLAAFLIERETSCRLSSKVRGWKVESVEVMTCSPMVTSTLLPFTAPIKESN